jgi:hypothetical protein
VVPGKSPTNDNSFFGYEACYFGSVNRAIVCAVLVVGLAIAPALGQKTCTKPSEGETTKDTAIHESSFRLVLPGKWVQKSSSDPTRWVYQHDSEQLTVSLPGGIFLLRGFWLNLSRV